MDISSLGSWTFMKKEQNCDKGDERKRKADAGLCLFYFFFLILLEVFLHQCWESDQGLMHARRRSAWELPPPCTPEGA